MNEVDMDEFSVHFSGRDQLVDSSQDSLFLINNKVDMLCNMHK